MTYIFPFFFHILWFWACGKEDTQGSPKISSTLLAEVSSGGVVFTIETLRKHNGDGNGNAKKAIGLMSKTTTLHVHHAFLYISLPSLHNYDVKLPDFKFTWERERQADKFYHLCLNSGAVPSLHLQRKLSFFEVTGRLAIIAKKNWKDANSIFQGRFHGRSRCRIVRSLVGSQGSDVR